jgi:16S rRNA (cytidine1402-2'-O)-methyltransferase
MGTLFIVSTPIGNLKDISFRAVEILKSVDIVLAEDTRKTGLLLKHFEIKEKKLIIFFEANEESKINQVIELLESGQTIALVSSAGTPLISDPGFKLVRSCVEKNIKVTPIPGASAVMALLAVAGLPTDKFVYLGFLPKKPGKKEKMLLKATQLGMTVVFYESPFRIIKTLEMLNSFHPGMELRVVVGRELTKKFEEIIRGNPNEILEKLKGKKIKGELVVGFR